MANQMIKVVGNPVFNHVLETYEFNLENGEQITIKEQDYDRIMLHKLNGKMYKAIVIEHEDTDTEIEYVGFELVG